MPSRHEVEIDNWDLPVSVSHRQLPQPSRQRIVLAAKAEPSGRRKLATAARYRHSPKHQRSFDGAHRRRRKSIS